MINELLQKKTIELIIQKYKQNKSIDQIYIDLNNEFIFQKDIEAKKPLFSYMGGKTKLCRQILKYIPDHKIYCEPFCGSLALLLAKGYKKTTNSHDYKEIINDSDENLVSFYLQVRDNWLKLFNLIDNIEYSNNAIYDNLESLSKNDIKKAAFWFTKISASFAGGFRKHGKSISYGLKGPNNVQRYLNKILRIKALSERLKNCYIFNEDYKKTILKFDSKETFLYLDPPYKNTRQYVDNRIDYQEFSNFVKGLKSKWIISHYYDNYIKENFRDYNIIHLESLCSIEKIKELGKRKKTNECIVLNFNPDEVDLYFKKKEKEYFLF